MSQKEQDKPVKKPFFEDERIPQHVKDVMRKVQEDLRARGSDLVEVDHPEGMQIIMNPPESWRPKKKEEK